MEFFSAKFQIYLVLFARLLAMMSVAPFFSGQNFSFFYRVSLAFLISLIVIPVTPVTPADSAMLQKEYFTILIEQAFLGFLIGVSLQILFGAFQMAGEFFSVQMGFGISEVFDPMSQISLPLMGTVNNLLALFVFFISGSHLHMLKAVVYSFERVPWFKETFLTAMSKQDAILDFLVSLSAGMFLIALKLALPIMGSLLLVSTTLGLLSKAAPQMNILMLGFPLKILVAFIVLVWISPIIVELMFQQFDIYFKHLDVIFRFWPNA